MAPIEFKGTDLAEAIASAGVALNLPPEKVKFSIVTTGSKGFWGLGRRSACILVNPDDPSVDSLAPPLRPPDISPPRTPDIGPVVEPERAPPFQENPEKKDQYSKNSEHQVKPLLKRDHPPSASWSPSPVRELRPLEWSRVPPVSTRPSPEEKHEPLDQGQATLPLAVLEEILKHLGIEAKITTARIGPRLVFSLDSLDNALLIGFRGMNLESLQLVVAKIVHRQSPELPSDYRVIVDVADYRARRQTQILASLREFSEIVRQTHRPQTFSGLNQAERRLVYTAIKPFKDLSIQNTRNRDSLIISLAPVSRPRRLTSSDER